MKQGCLRITKDKSDDSLDQFQCTAFGNYHESRITEDISLSLICYKLLQILQGLLLEMAVCDSVSET